NVCKSFDKRVVLSDVALSVSKNEFVCITGESGAGKTTLLNLIGLLDKPDSGEVSINDKTHFTPREILKLRRN
ncbi:ATP-binding cassette domain-containing protein, partial [Acinetobacter pittii]|uniref:ATP-binding cassette domain-containing protein n=1 Tax=Acinetobacter pittii TaxID=48296 RepID=UPI00281337FB